MSTPTTPAGLISVEALATRLGAPNLSILDASWYLPAMGRDGRAEYEQAHIPGALYFDIDAVADRTSDLPHMVPRADDFAETAAAMGIGNESDVVVYDGLGLFSAPRVWWMFRLFGHERIAVLEGGLRTWQAAGLPLTDRPERPRPAKFKAAFRPGLVRGLDQIRAGLMNPQAPLVDARTAGRFHGREPEPRAGLRSGHIPGAINLPFQRLLSDDGTTLRAPEDLARTFESVGLDPAEPAVCSCGSGVSAAIIALAFYVLGNHDAAVYDGSWAEWGGRADTPVER